MALSKLEISRMPVSDTNAMKFKDFHQYPDEEVEYNLKTSRNSC